MTTDNQKKYEAAAKAHFDAIGRPDDGNEMRAWIAGASFAEKEGWNAAIDKALKCFTAEAYALHNDVWKEIEKLKL